MKILLSQVNYDKCKKCVCKVQNAEETVQKMKTKNVLRAKRKENENLT